jgi:hypothetical protein
MEHKRLFLLIEGDDDERFFQRIIKPKYEEKYDTVTLWKYAQVRNQKVDNFLRSIKAMGADYIYIVDINLAPCVTAKKQEIRGGLKNIDQDKIVVVIREIEGWYLAGLDDKISQHIGIRPSNTSDNITKEQFDDWVPKKFDSRIDFMMELLKYFSIEMAKQKNRSFRYFLEKHDC